MSVGATDWFFWLLAALGSGVLLARFNVLALALASIMLLAALLAFYFVHKELPVQFLLFSLAIMFALQVGYALGQFLRRPPF